MLEKLFQRFNIGNPIIAEVKPQHLHGVDLSEWTLLGISRITFTYIQPSGANASEWANVFHFVNRLDTSQRKLVIPEQLSAPTIDFTKHEWYVVTGSLWMAGELPLWYGINSWTSDHLKNFMALFHDMEWDAKDGKWQKIHREVYEGAWNDVPKENVKVVKPGLPIVHKSEPDANGNSKVITVAFGKKKDDNEDEPGPRPA